MNKRFATPEWIAQHNFSYSSWKDIPDEKLQSIKRGLSRFRDANPIVSIVIPVWNEERNILRTLSSFSAMEIPFPAELILVNNNSKDSTQEILDFMNIKSVTESRQGIAHARLAGLNISLGTYQLCGDGDSLYPPTWIKTMIEPLIKNDNLTCVYGNYSFLPSGNTGRLQLGWYELLAEGLFEFRRLKREFLNVRGANFGFRVAQGKQVKGFEMTVTRIYDNDEKSSTYVIFGEDGRMGRKLGELGKLKLVRNSQARIWTSSRRLLKDGSLSSAFIKRCKLESVRLLDYIFGAKKVRQTTDNLQPK
jgi:glycosyltransferase involved in cell wall biosynthesis